MKPKELLFATAGIPRSCVKGGTGKGIETVRSLGLGAMEMEFVRQVYIKKDKAPEIAKVAKKEGIVLTSHAPYFINLNAKEDKKIYASYNYIQNSAIITALCGGWSSCFHAGYYMKEDEKKVYSTIKSHLKKIVKNVKDTGNEVWIRPEVSGKKSQFGSLNEILKLSQDIEGVMPCIDFSHLHARTNGLYNSREEFLEIMTDVEKMLGRTGLNNMHIHLSGIAYGEKGEKNHLNLKDSDMNYRDLCKVWKEFNIKGVVVCESPNIEEDALLIKKTFEKA